MQYTLITGACGGLGGAFCEALSERGEPLFLTGRSEERLSALKETLSERNPLCKILCRACDLTKEEDRRAFFEYADALGANFSRLIYVAGVDTQMAFERYDEQKLLFQTRVNLEGAVSFINSFLKRSPLDGKTEILAIGSMSASTPMPYFALYSATKKALEYFCAGLREELKGRAKTTCVLPGGIPTREDIKENIREHGFWGKISAKSPRAVADAALKAVHKNRRKVVVGFWNKVIKFATDVAPMSVKMRFIARRWSKTTKDHFSE